MFLQFYANIIRKFCAIFVFFPLFLGKLMFYQSKALTDSL